MCLLFLLWKLVEAVCFRAASAALLSCLLVRTIRGIVQPPQLGVAVGNVVQLRPVQFPPSEQDWTSDWDQTQAIWHDGALKEFSFRPTW